MARTYTSIIKSLKDTDGFDPGLFCEMRDCAKKAGQPLRTLFFEYRPGGQTANSATIKHWLDDPECQRMLDEYENPPLPAAPAGRVWFGKDQNAIELMNQCVELMSQHFIQCTTGGKNRIYLLTDPDRRVVEPFDKDADRDLVPIRRTVRAALLAEGCVVDKGKAVTLLGHFETYGEVGTQKPSTYLLPDEPGYCLHRCTVLPDPRVPFPVLRDFLDRCNDGPALAAFLYGVYSKRYKGRQIVWIEGPGEDGKSVFMRTFGETIFGRTFGNVSWDDIKGNASFFMSQMEDKRFGYVADCSNPGLIMTATFKSLASSGADMVTINRKNVQQYQAMLEAYFVVISNLAPDISGERSSVSRILYIKMTPRSSKDFDVNIGQTMAAELPGFLAYGKECYDRLCTDNYQIQVNDAVRDATTAQIDSTVERWHVILAKNFVVDTDALLSAEEMAEVLKDERLNQFEGKNFKDWLRKNYGVKLVGRQRMVYSNLRLRTPADDRLDLDANEPAEG